MRRAGVVAGGTRRNLRHCTHGCAPQGNAAIRMGLGFVSHAGRHSLRYRPSGRSGAAEGSWRVQTPGTHHRGRESSQRRHRHRGLLPPQRIRQGQRQNDRGGRPLLLLGSHRCSVGGPRCSRSVPRVARPRRRRRRPPGSDIRHAICLLPVLLGSRVSGGGERGTGCGGARGGYWRVRARVLHRRNRALSAPLLGDAHLRG
mmetsp:Transcript_12633/g.30669  ORF Transcript_12633/g.30669 Transcript_12633/m.30669 type:complete len:201 (-) Transcript_12633:1432-2034(-)